MINWKTLLSLSELVERTEKQDESHYVLIFKHSPRCPVSVAALRRLEKDWEKGQKGANSGLIVPFLVDVLKERPLSTAIAEHYDIEHASPQVLLIKGADCLHNASHEAITYAALGEALK